MCHNDSLFLSALAKHTSGGKSMQKTQTNTTQKATPLPYRLTNDYLFRAVFQSRPKALEGLCRSVLHLSPEDAVTVEIRNPVILGQQINSKEFILDLAVIVNGSVYLNLEMQMYHEPFWVERSISYTCRSFDNLNRGAAYGVVLPVIHVGFLDYDLFPEYPEFFATYQLSNVKNHNIYSDKFCISVVNLNHTELATEKDKTFSTDLWARAFKAESWEEINMLAQQNEYLKEAVSGIAVLTEDEQIRQQCQAREDFEYWERIKENGHKRELAEKDRQYQMELAEKDKLHQMELTEKDKLHQMELTEKDKLHQMELTEKDRQYQMELAKLTTRIAELEARNK